MADDQINPELRAIINAAADVAGEAKAKAMFESAFYKTLLRVAANQEDVCDRMAMIEDQMLGLSCAVLPDEDDEAPSFGSSDDEEDEAD